MAAAVAVAALRLAIAWIAARPDREPLAAGLVFAAILAGGAFLFTLGGGLGLDTALRRAAPGRPARARGHLAAGRRAAPRGCARCPGARSASFAACRARSEAGAVLDQLGGGGAPRRGRRDAGGLADGSATRPVPFLDAVLAWVVTRVAPSQAAPAPGNASASGNRARRAADRAGGRAGARARVRSRKAPARRSAGCRTALRAGAARAATVQRAAATGSRGGRTRATPTGPRRARRWPRACG